MRREWPVLFRSTAMALLSGFVLQTAIPVGFAFADPLTPEKTRVEVAADDTVVSRLLALGYSEEAAAKMIKELLPAEVAALAADPHAIALVGSSSDDNTTTDALLISGAIIAVFAIFMTTLDESRAKTPPPPPAVSKFPFWDYYAKTVELPIDGTWRVGDTTCTATIERGVMRWNNDCNAAYANKAKLIFLRRDRPSHYSCQSFQGAQGHSPAELVVRSPNSLEVILESNRTKVESFVRVSLRDEQMFLSLDRPEAVSPADIAAREAAEAADRQARCKAGCADMKGKCIGVCAGALGIVGIVAIASKQRVSPEAAQRLKYENEKCVNDCAAQCDMCINGCQ